MKRTQRKHQSETIFSHFWNEFLFARAFEYETPLTPDEMAEALQQLDGQKYTSWFLSMRGLVHRVTYADDGDKAGTFKIELESKDRDKWWETDTAMQLVEGSMTSQPDTGMTVISGKTRFSGRYYAILLFIFMSNLFLQFGNGSLGLQVLWIAVIMSFWFTMYRERNKLADRVDDIIMTAKSEKSRVHLMDSSDEHDIQSDDAQQAKQEYSR